MPGPADTFQQIAGPQEGPFSQYLRPRPIDNPTTPASGWESGGVGAGEIALGFLKGVRQNRLAQAAEQDKNVQTGLDNFRQHVSAQLQDPRLTDAGRQAILSEANRVMNEHMHYEVRDVPKHGVAGFFKNLLVNATGGQIKVREPINWDEATGRISNIANTPEHNQQHNFSSAIAESQQVMEALKRDNPNPTSEQVKQALLPSYFKVLQNAPNYAGAFAQTMGMGFPAAGSSEHLMQQMNAPSSTPVTQPPPGTVEQYPANVRGSAGMTSPPPVAPQADIRPADYRLGGPREYEILVGLHGDTKSHVTANAVHPIVVNGQHTMGRVIDAPNQYAGYWDVNQKKQIPPGADIRQVTLNQPKHYMTGADSTVSYIDPDTGSLKQVMMADPLNPSAQIPYKVREGFQLVDPGDGRAPVLVRNSEVASGTAAGGPAAAEARQKRGIAAAMERVNVLVGSSSDRQGVGIGARRVHERENLKLSYDRRVDALKRSARAAAQNAVMGRPLTQAEVAKAEQSVQSDIAEIEGERGEALSAFDAWKLPEAKTPAQTAKPTAAPRTSAPPSAPAKKAAFSDLPDK